MPKCWFVVCHVGKGEIWKPGCKCAIKDTRVQKTVVWVLYRKIVFVYSRAIPFMPVAVSVAKERETESRIRDRAQGLLRFTSCEVSNSTAYVKKNRICFCSYYQDCVSIYKVGFFFVFFLNHHLLKTQRMLLRYVYSFFLFSGWSDVFSFR